MATTINKTVKETGGDYSLPSLALAAMPADMVVADEQWEVEIFAKAGGYSDSLTFPSMTTDAARYPRFYAAAGEEYDRATDTGAYIFAFKNFNGVISNTSVNYLRWEGVGVKNTAGVSSHGYIGAGDNCLFSAYFRAGVGGTGSGLNLNNATNTTVSNCITEEGINGIFTNNFSSGTITNHLSIDNATSGYDKGSLGNDWIVTNSLYLGSGVWTNDTGWNVATDFNAAEDTSAVGGNSLQNRTTADLVNYAGGDFRTASASALSTAGSGGTFIGFALEASSGISITPDAILSSQTLSEPTLMQGHSLSVNNIISANTVSESVLSQQGALSVNPVLSAQTISEPVFTQANVLSVNNITTANTISEVTLVIAGALGVDDLSSSQSITLTSFIQQNLLDVDDLSNAQTISQSVIDTGLNLIVQDISSAQSISESGFTQHNIILVDPITSAQFIGVVNISGDGQDIGTVTASFKEDDISVKYGILNITVQFKE